MTPPHNLKLLLYDRGEPTRARDLLSKHVTGIEHYGLLETRSIRGYEVARYATAGGYGDHIFVGIGHDRDRWTVHGAIIQRTPAFDETDYRIDVLTDMGVRSVRHSDTLEDIFAELERDPA